MRVDVSNQAGEWRSVRVTRILGERLKTLSDWGDKEKIIRCTLSFHCHLNNHRITLGILIISDVVAEEGLLCFGGI